MAPIMAGTSVMAPTTIRAIFHCGCLHSVIRNKDMREERVRTFSNSCYVDYEDVFDVTVHSGY